MLMIAALQCSWAQQKPPQKDSFPKSSLGISFLTTWGRANTPYNGLDTFFSQLRKSDTASGFNHGIQLNYIRYIYKGVFFRAGVGYFKQIFNLHRKIEAYPNNIWLNYHLISAYKYENIIFTTGVGYKYHLRNRISIIGSMDYNSLYSYKQKYIIDSPANIAPRIRHQNIFTNEFLDIRVGVNYHIVAPLSLGVETVLPLKVNWQYDGLLDGDIPNNKMSKIAENISSFGLAVNLTCHF